MLTVRLIGCALIGVGAIALDRMLEREARALPERMAEAIGLLERLREEIVGYGRPPDEAARRVCADCRDLSSLSISLAEPLPDGETEAIRSLPHRLAAIDCDRAAVLAAVTEPLRAAMTTRREALGERLRLIRLGCFGGAAAVILLLW